MARRRWAGLARRVRGTPTPETTGYHPIVFRQVTPVPPEAPVTERQVPKELEPPFEGITVDESFPPPGQPEPVIPARPGTPLIGRVRSPRVEE